MKHLVRFPHCLLLTAILCPVSTAAEADGPQGFQTLFNGKNLDGWEGNPKLWRVEDGVITGQTTPDNPTKGNTFLIWRKGAVDDFELQLKFRIEGGNSGIQYRSKEVGEWVISGYQADFDSAGKWAGILYEEKGRGILAKRGNQVVIDEQGKKNVVGKTADEQEIVSALKKEDWNDYTIIARGNHLVHVINGKTTVDVTDNQQEKRSMSGLLALQLHAGPPMKVQFKDIRLKKLDARDGSQGPAGATGKAGASSAATKKKVVFIAGKPSHGYGSHEHNAGCLLLAKHLQQALPEIETVVIPNGWPAEGTKALEGADAIVVYCDGGGRHLLNPHVDELDEFLKPGVGLACIHYGVEVPKGKSGDAFLKWIGGYFETNWSVNPHWTAKFTSFRDHPITRGVEPFEINDEWYFHMRFRDQLHRVTPVLSAHPPESTMKRRDGAHSGNPHVRAAVQRGEIQHLAWAAERDDGGRGFGFTGGHFHLNWADANFRKVVLNGIVWIAGGEVPAGGVSTEKPSQVELEENQDYPKPAKK